MSYDKGTADDMMDGNEPEQILPLVGFVAVTDLKLAILAGTMEIAKILRHGELAQVREAVYLAVVDLIAKPIARPIEKGAAQDANL